MDARAQRAIQNNERIGAHVRRELSEARSLVQEAEELGAKVETKRYCLGRYPNLIGRYFLSKQAEKKTKSMTDLNRRLERKAKFAYRETLKYMDTPGDFFHSASGELAYQELLNSLRDETVNRIGLYGIAW